MERNKVTPEDLAPRKEKGPEEVAQPQKNPWWVKSLPHAFIAMLFIDIWCRGKITALDVIIVAIWIWYGSRIQRDKKILDRGDIRLYVMILVICVIASYKNILQLIQWLSSLWGGVFVLNAIIS